jgi:hypothetical protein
MGDYFLRAFSAIVLCGNIQIVRAEVQTKEAGRAVTTSNIILSECRWFTVVK